MLTFVGNFLCQGSNLLIFMIIFPVTCSILLLALGKHNSVLTAVSCAFAAINFLFAVALHGYGEFFMEIPYTSYGFEFVLKNNSFSALFLLLTGAVLLLIVIYIVNSMKDTSHRKWYLFYLFLSLGMINGALLSEDLGIMLFFTEGLLAVIFGILLLDNSENPKAATKAIGTLGVAVLTFMFGIVLTVHTAHTGLMGQIQILPVQGENVVGFLCIMIGALGIAGLMPFHGWTIDAAEDSSEVFTAAFTGGLLKILGVYIGIRVLGVYELIPGSTSSRILVVLGVLSFVFGAMMAVAQKSISRIMAYMSTSLLGLIVVCMVSEVSLGIIVAILASLVLLNMVSLLFIEKESSSEVKLGSEKTWFASDKIRNVFLLKEVYRMADKGMLDPYNWMMAVIGVFSDICTAIEHGISWIYDKGIPGLVNKAGTALQDFNTGNLTRYLSLVVAGVFLIVIIFLITIL